MLKKNFWGVLVGCALFFSGVTHGGAQKKAGEHDQYREYVVSVKTEKSVKALKDLSQHIPYAERIVLSKKKKNGFETLVLVKAPVSDSVAPFTAMLSEGSQINWIEQNRVFEGDDPREGFHVVNPFADDPVDPQPEPEPRTNDPRLSEQLHHEVMGNFEAWDTTMGSENIIVAVTDDGVELEHEDLKNRIWVNADEIPGNGIDDDENGYIDDVNGWDFCAKDNDPNPGGSHGTHVAGIIAAEANNETGVAGTAPNVTIMPLKWYMGGCSWNAAVIAETYQYAVDNGAKIINTSYNVDWVANDATYLAAIDYVNESDVILVNSAGNGNRNDSPRAKNDQLILAVSTMVDPGVVDKRSSFSNYGYRTDLAGPGSNILATVLNNQYRKMSGTSMAAPNVAASIALLWSLRPSWTKEQVIAKMNMTSDNIHDANDSNYENKLGAGRVNTARALTEKNALPQFKDFKVFRDGSGFFQETPNQSTRAINLKINSHLTANRVLSSDSWSLVFLGEDNLLGTSDDKSIAVKGGDRYLIGSNLVEIRFEEALQGGTYQLTGNASQLIDVFGQNLDGNGDGVSGDDYILEFEVPAGNLNSDI